LRQLQFAVNKSVNPEDAMKSILRVVLGVFLVLAVAGCGGGGHSSSPEITTQILSDPVSDGDIALDPLTGLFTITQVNTQSVFAGINPVTNVEYRAFLDFPLTGAGGVPGKAIIVSAFLDIVINNIETQRLGDTIPIRIDLVSFSPPSLRGTDFDRTLQPALATTTIIPPISQADFGKHVLVNITTLMDEAQRLGLANLQLRILEDLGPVVPGRIEINDTTGANSSTLAPLLEVTYF
jgi:hypothetical protein